MIKFTNRYLNIVSIIFTIIIFFIISKTNLLKYNARFDSLLISKLFKKYSFIVEMNSDNVNGETEDKNDKLQLNEIIDEKNQNTNGELKMITKDTNEISSKNKWTLSIPKISLTAEVNEGTSKEVMENYIGHFEGTSKTNGNIGLAAHNRGYTQNYFSRINELREGDEINYEYNEFKKTYLVYRNIIINDTDWSTLKDNKKNIITLITCVKNEPSYRRCVQAIEKGGDTN